MKLAARLEDFRPTPLAAMRRRLADLRKRGVRILSLNEGEPDFPVPDVVQLAAIDSMRRGDTRYTASEGIVELRSAIVERYERRRGLKYGLDEVVASAGAKQVLYNALLATLDPGDEVLVPTPYWMSYPDIVLLAGGSPRLVATSPATGYKLTADLLHRALTPATRLVILNSPSNPTGSMYRPAELQALATVLLDHPAVGVICDDIYEEIVFDGSIHHTLLEVEARLRDRCLIVSGLSKSHSMTGWRLGYGVGPAHWVQAMIGIQSQTTSHPCSLSQWAGVRALNMPQDEVVARCARFEQRRDSALLAFGAVPGFTCIRPDGAFYLWVDCHSLLGTSAPAGQRIVTGIDLADYLLTSAATQLMPGEAFGSPGHLRISFATDEDLLTEAAARIADAARHLA